MRSVMISITIILFCLSMGVINEVNADYFTEKNRTLYGGWEGEPYLTADDLPAVNSRSNFNKTLYDNSAPSEQPSTINWIDTVLSSFNLVVQFVSFFINTLVNSTIGFSSFIQTLGHPESDKLLVPSDIADVIAILVNINHIFAIGQIWMKWSMKGAM